MSHGTTTVLCSASNQGTFVKRVHPTVSVLGAYIRTLASLALGIVFKLSFLFAVCFFYQTSSPLTKDEEGQRNTLQLVDETIETLELDPDSDLALKVSRAETELQRDRATIFSKQNCSGRKRVLLWNARCLMQDRGCLRRTPLLDASFYKSPVAFAELTYITVFRRAFQHNLWITLVGVVQPGLRGAEDKDWSRFL